MSKHSITRRRKHHTQHLIGDESFVEIRQPDFALSAAVVYVYSGETVADTRVEIGVEVHPLTAQRGESIAMPEKTRKAIELR